MTTATATATAGRPDTDPWMFVDVMDADQETGYVLADRSAFAVLAEELGVELD